MEKTQVSKALKEIATGFDDLSVLARLEYVSAILCNRAGDRNSEECDPVLRLCEEIVDGVHRDIKEHPEVLRLLSPYVS